MSQGRSDLQGDENHYTWNFSSLSIALRDEEVCSFISRPSLATRCSFSPSVFVDVMDNLIQNPNITSSHLFRADVFYDSDKDSSFAPDAWLPHLSTSKDCTSSSPAFESISNFVKHMRKELKPRRVHVEGFDLRRVLVRKMIPRNPLLDQPLVQTCCFFRSIDHVQDTQILHNTNGADHSCNNTSKAPETNIVIYLPHVETPEEIPWYHPPVKAVAFCYSCNRSNTDTQSAHKTNNESKHELQPQNRSEGDEALGPANPEEFSIHVLPFQRADEFSESFNHDSRLNRTLKNLLFTIKKHGQGLQRGYQKRSNHDQIVPRATLQDTYVRLKQKYAKLIIHEYWKEETDSSKGVFEDLGIAAFLIELWSQMYSNNQIASSNKFIKDDKSSKVPFPGFVDIGCGNGVLTYILLAEGYPGYGFDARSRKTWKAFPDYIQQQLRRMVLLPTVLNENALENMSSTSYIPTDGTSSIEVVSSKKAEMPMNGSQVDIHSGFFAPGTFIISNHADELTPWTPLLGYLSSCPFISIPCCSHDLTGAKYRYPASFLKNENQKNVTSSKTNVTASINKQRLVQVENGDTIDSRNQGADQPERLSCRSPATGKLEPEKSTATQKQPPIPSAYATLTAFVAHLTATLGYRSEKEELRIPSTRNACIVGRKWQDESPIDLDLENKCAKVQQIIEKETGKSIAQVRDIWQSNAEAVLKCKESHTKH